MTRQEMIDRIHASLPKASDPNVRRRLEAAAAKLEAWTDEQFEAQKAKEIAAAPNHRQVAKLIG